MSRCIALLLVPGLVLDPASAAPLSMAPLRAGPFASHSAAFREQALAHQALDFLRVLLDPRPRIQMIQSSMTDRLVLLGTPPERNPIRATWPEKTEPVRDAPPAPTPADPPAVQADPYDPLIDDILSAQGRLSSMGDRLFTAEGPKLSLELKTRRAAGESMEKIVVEAIALFRETTRRHLKRMTPEGPKVVEPTRDQISDALSLILEGPVAVERETGSGKTVSLALAAYVWALEGKGVHIHTENAALARWDANWMRLVFKHLAISVGTLDPVDNAERHQREFLKDVTYGASADFIFADLRDSQEPEFTRRRQRPYPPAVILLDDAHLPLINNATDSRALSIAGLVTGVSVTHHLQRIFDFAVEMRPAHYQLERQTRTALLTKAGKRFLAERFGSGHPLSPEQIVDVQDALAAIHLLRRNKHYVVTAPDNRVELLDTSMRIRKGMVWEGHTNFFVASNERRKGTPVRLTSRVRPDNLTTSQAWYAHRADLLRAGSANFLQFAPELRRYYKLRVLIKSITTRGNLIRHPKKYFETASDKRRYIVKRILQIQRTGQPVFIGTHSIEEAEVLYTLLKRENPKTRLLTALNEIQETAILSAAGSNGALTIVAGLAGVGTDIRGSLFIIGAEAGATRDVDDQLQGRAGRWDDPGEALICVSLEDEVLRDYAPSGARTTRYPAMPEGEPGELDPQFVEPVLHAAQAEAAALQQKFREEMFEYNMNMENLRERYFKGVVDRVRHRRLAQALRLLWSQFLDENIKLRRQVPREDYFRHTQEAYIRLVEETTRLHALEPAQLELRLSEIMPTRKGREHAAPAASPERDKTMEDLRNRTSQVRLRLQTLLKMNWTPPEIARALTATAVVTRPYQDVQTTVRYVLEKEEAVAPETLVQLEAGLTALEHVESHRMDEQVSLRNAFKSLIDQGLMPEDMATETDVWIEVRMSANEIYSFLEGNPLPHGVREILLRAVITKLKEPHHFQRVLGANQKRKASVAITQQVRDQLKSLLLTGRATLRSIVETAMSELSVLRLDEEKVSRFLEGDFLQWQLVNALRRTVEELTLEARHRADRESETRYIEGVREAVRAMLTSGIAPIEISRRVNRDRHHTWLSADAIQQIADGTLQVNFSLAKRIGKAARPLSPQQETTASGKTRPAAANILLPIGVLTVVEFLHLLPPYVSLALGAWAFALTAAAVRGLTPRTSSRYLTSAA